MGGSRRYLPSKARNYVTKPTLGQEESRGVRLGKNTLRIHYFWNISGTSSMFTVRKTYLQTRGVQLSGELSEPRLELAPIPAPSRPLSKAALATSLTSTSKRSRFTHVFTVTPTLDRCPSKKVRRTVSKAANVLPHLG